LLEGEGVGFVLPNFSPNSLPNLRKYKNFKVSKVAVKVIFSVVHRHFYNLRFENRTKYWLFLIDCAFFEMKHSTNVEKNILFNS